MLDTDGLLLSDRSGFDTDLDKARARGSDPKKKVRSTLHNFCQLGQAPAAFDVLCKPLLMCLVGRTFVIREVELSFVSNESNIVEDDPACSIRFQELGEVNM